MIKNFKTLFFSIVFLFSLLLTGCSSSTSPEAVSKQKAEPTESVSSSPAASEDRLYEQELDAQGAVLKEEKESLKKRKSSDDDMERLD